MNKLKVFWVEKDGSIFTRDRFKIKLDHGRFIEIQHSIAFNVGQETASRIVRLHNDDLLDQLRSKVQLGLITRAEFMRASGIGWTFEGE